MIMKSDWRCLALLIVTGGSACTGSEQRATTTQVDTIGDIVHVRSIPAAVTWSLTELMTIHGGDHGFTAVSMAVDRDRNLYIADYVEATIQVFDSTGAWIRAIGRRGAGPSEFEDLYSIAWLGDTLVALDPGNSRVGLLTRSGDWLGHRQQRRIGGDGVRLIQGDRAVYAPGVLVRDSVVVATLIRHTADGWKDTVELPDRRRGQPPIGIVCETPDGGIHGFSIPFSSRPLLTVSPGGDLVLARSGEYRISFARAGDTIRVVEAPANPIPVIAAEWADSLRSYQAWKEKFAGAPCDPPGVSAPATRPVIQDIWFDDEGRMWVERTDQGGATFDVFNTDGILMASLPGPTRDHGVIPTVRNGRLYVLVSMESGEHTVQVYQVVKNSRD